jgi:hypothetical protein
MRSRIVNSKQQLQAVRDEYVMNGYTVKQETETVVTVTNFSLGSIPLHILMAIVSFGFLNVIYVVYRLIKGGDTVEIRIENT